MDDAKWITATIYITSIVLAITLFSFYTLSGSRNAFSAVFTVGLFIGTSFIMAFVFVSKVIEYTELSVSLVLVYEYHYCETTIAQAYRVYIGQVAIGRHEPTCMLETFLPCRLTIDTPEFHGYTIVNESKEALIRTP